MTVTRWAVLALASAGALWCLLDRRDRRPVDELLEAGPANPAIQAAFVGRPPDDLVRSERGHLIWTGLIGDRRLRHGDAVQGVRYSPDGSWLVTASGGTLKVWRVADGREIRALRGHREIASVAIAPDGRRIVSGCTDGTVKLWDVATGNEIRELKAHAEDALTVAFSRDGTLIASGSEDGSIHVNEAATGTVVQTIQVKGHVAAVQFTPGRTIWAATFGDVMSDGRDNLIAEYDIVTGVRLRVLRGVGFWSVFSLSADGTLLISTSSDATVLWDLGTLRAVRRFKGRETVLFSRGGERIVAGGSDGRVTVWDTANGAEVAAWYAHGEGIADMALSPDGRFVATAADLCVKVWNLDSGKLVLGEPRDSGSFMALAASPDGQWICAADGQVGIWDAVSGEFRRPLQGDFLPVVGLCVSDDGKLISGVTWRAPWFPPAPVPIWDAETGRVVSTIEPGFHVWEAQLWGTARVLVAGSDNIRLMGFPSGEVVRKLGNVGGWPTDMALLGDGKRVVSSGQHGVIRVWDANSTWVLGKHDSRSLCVAGSPDGKRVVSGDVSGLVKVWDVAERKLARLLQGHEDSVGDVAVSADGKWIFSTSHDQTLRLWNFDGKQLDVIRVDGEPASLAIAGSRVWVGCMNGTICVYSFTPPR